MDIQISLPANFVLSARNVEVTVETSKLTPEILSLLVAHGIKQKVVDAASGAVALAVRDKFGDKAKPASHKEWLTTKEATAAIVAYTESLMLKAADGLHSGEWSQRGSGPVDETTTVQRIVAKAAMKAKLGGESEAWKDFLALPASDANERLDAVWAKNADRLADAFDAELSARSLRRNKPKVDIDL